MNWLMRIFSKKNQRISTTSICSICDVILDESKITEKDGLTFCHKDLVSYNNNSWELIETVESTSKNPEKGVLLYEKKNKEYKKGNDGFLKSSYKQKNGVIITVLNYYAIKK